MGYEVTLRVDFDAGHRLQKHKGKCRNVHGHRYVFEVTVGAETLTEEGFVMDFGDLKSTLKELVEKLDHAFLYEKGDPIGQFIKGQGLKVVELDFAPTAENLAKYVYDFLKGVLSNHPLKVIKVVCHETPTSSAAYSESSDWVRK
jgi:6-pyruvoyltetrahydropterin/6-carboxytetrahydropterin synthase